MWLSCCRSLEDDKMLFFPSKGGDYDFYLGRESKKTCGGLDSDVVVVFFFSLNSKIMLTATIDKDNK